MGGKDERFEEATPDDETTNDAADTEGESGVRPLNLTIAGPLDLSNPEPLNLAVRRKRTNAESTGADTGTSQEAPVQPAVTSLAIRLYYPN